MNHKSRFELYHLFIEFISHDIQKERHRVNRRMKNVFIWCFLLPAATSATFLLLVKLKVFPRSVKSYLDWLVLIFPIAYSLYILGSEVLPQMPSALKKGGISSSLIQSLREGEWRERVVHGMSHAVPANELEWKWIIKSFDIDLKAIQYRTRFLTALAGAVFFLLMQGIDSLADDDGKLAWLPSSFLGWVESSTSHLSQFVGLGLFLVLLYLSGSQTYHSLKRYLDCAELVATDKTKR